MAGSRGAPGWVESGSISNGILTLVHDVYRYRGLKDRELWQDRSTLSIPIQYQFLFVQLAEVAATDLRSTEEVAALAEDAASMRVTALGGSRYLEQP